MKAISKIALAVFGILLCPSCDEKKPPLSKEGEVISKLQHDKAQPDYIRKGAGIMLDILAEKENITSREFTNAKRKVSSVRSSATVEAWIALLNSTEKKLPDSLPSPEEMDFEEKESYRRNPTEIHFSTTTRLSLIGSCISALASLDMPEAKSEIEAFLQRFEKKYGNSSGGKKMLELYKTERNQQEEGVRLKIAPWQVGPNPSAP